MTGGSSPHTRGTLVMVFPSVGWSGIIPAYAGNTLKPDLDPVTNGDHPRMRGEHGRRDHGRHAGTASSPHARGTPEATTHWNADTGIIPACAGNTRTPDPRPCQRWDHPRMRGEHGYATVAWSGREGSSPHARGTLRRHARENQRIRIIPACAGNTAVTPREERAREDHPRMRGEHRIKQMQNNVDDGSSPHARGTLQGYRVQRDRSGIIPACAGNTRIGVWLSMRKGDHPRMRGEHPDWIPGIGGRSGSSPHARGTRSADGGQWHLEGIIPACAGNTITRASPTNG